jgi:hypothetical protein
MTGKCRSFYNESGSFQGFQMTGDEVDGQNDASQQGVGTYVGRAGICHRR